MQPVIRYGQGRERGRTMKPFPKRELLLVYPLASRLSSLFPIPVLSSCMIGLELVNVTNHTTVSYLLVCSLSSRLCSKIFRYFSLFFGLIAPS